MSIIYNLGIALYSFAIYVASFFNEKAKFLKNGRKNIWKEIENANLGEDVVWLHSASLGEFEQGRPLIEKIKTDFPQYKIVLTFFSPSGYEIRKNYKEADLIIYLPADTKRNAAKFLKAINPKKVFFIKYEYWHHFFKEINSREIPLYMVSAIFRPSQMFFKKGGVWYRNILKSVTHFYIQDEKSAELLKSIGFENYSVVGDTRFDRVSEIAASAPKFEEIEKIISGKKVLVAGSTWPPDEDILVEYINNSQDDFKFIIAPHEIGDDKIKTLISKLKVPYIRYTEINKVANKDAKVLIIDTIGMLSFIYQYADVAYIGGGFGKGIHNILEAATFGIPVIFGPKHTKFKEAVDLLELEGGFTISNKKEFAELLSTLFYSETFIVYENSKLKAKEYVQKMSGATEFIMKNF